MKKIYVLIFSFFLVACSDKNQDKFESSSDKKLDEVPEIMIEHKPIISDGVLAVSEEKHKQDDTVVVKKNRNQDQIICSNQDLTEWYGFDESEDKPKCKLISKFKLSSYKCDISKNAFGAEKDAVLLEEDEKNIFAYDDEKNCNEILEIRNSNSP